MKVMGLFGKKVENPVEKIQEKEDVKSCGKGSCEGTCSETKGDNRMKID